MDKDTLPTAVDNPLLNTHPGSPKLDAPEADDKDDEVADAIIEDIEHHDSPHGGAVG